MIISFSEGEAAGKGEEKDGREGRKAEERRGGRGGQPNVVILREEAFAHFCSSSTIYTRERLEEREGVHR